MKKLSRPITELKNSYDVLVIGSGYGGSIAASRMSRIGKSVCLLEKGKEFLPGDFPSKLTEASGEMNFNMGKKSDDNNGLYDFTMGDGISVFKGCGLGGTSLVNANVSIKPEPRVMEDNAWPAEIRNNISSFHEGVERACDMLKPNPYPEGKNGYPILAKTEAMRKSADYMSEEFRLLDINVNFENKEENHVGIKQGKCNNCGDCVTGCNVGAKNTTAMNYLPDAYNHGAEIFTNIDVRHIEKSNGRWKVFFNVLNTGREKFDAPELFVFADNVIVSAGSLGSTEILLRSKAKGLSTSDMLGQNMTGNGDVLAFGYNNDQPINGIGMGDNEIKDIANVGPCITSVIDMRNRDNLADGMTLEEGTVPAPIRAIMATTLVTVSRLFGNDTDRGFKDFWREKWREITSLFKGPFHGAVNHTQIYLVMTHDDSKGKMSLKDDRLKIDWPGVGKQEIFKKVDGELTAATSALGGNKVPNPTWNKMMDFDLVTVHPLGGCGMANDANTGVTDHKGQVFSGTTGTDLHPGLYVMDGAVIPKSVGTNPLLTISGLAERSCKLIAESMGASINYSFENAPRKEGQNNVTKGVQFTETMRGYFSLDEKENYQRGHDKGKAAKSPFEFTLTIHSEDVDTFVQNKDHQAELMGSMVAPALSDKPLSALNGTFNLFVEDKANPDTKKMLYSSVLTDVNGEHYYFEGFKQVQNDKGFDVWADTTTLFITLRKGGSKEGEVIGKGMLKILIKDFMTQLTTMKSVNTKGASESISSIAAFGKFFSGNVFDTYIKKIR
ncbi:GMC family oxidoreductase N-terminal domain-containing protein [Owenweeksia hongkongensis]|uniref:GMC family oxidoreductase N-terminal domain-containing protein n=1 Tax=Owenweeksia hongkongensis TaxID=253245 RepID=UPI003A8DA774